MATKKKSNKKSQSTWQWYKSLSSSYKTLLFVLIFVVLGGGFAVYRSFAYSWFKVVSNSQFDVSVCKYKVAPVGYYARWAVYNKTSSNHTYGIGQSDTDVGYVSGDIFVTAHNIGLASPPSTQADGDANVLPSGTHPYFVVIDESPTIRSKPAATFNLNPSFLVDCGSSK